jgi:pimeloyl-ACP methyl ester carboxylesterase
MKLFRRRPWASLARGKLVDVGTHRLHLYCTGGGSPTVVFDSALAGSVLSWILVQPEVATFARACSYDRAGHGWSDAGPMPRTLSRIVDELHTLLRRANVPPPFVLVGHSYGGLVAQLYVSRYRDEVAGMVLVDSAHAKDWAYASDRERARLETGIRLCRRGASVARFGVGRVVSSLVGVGALAAARGLTGVLSGGVLSGQHEEVLAPVLRLPPEVRPLLRRMWIRPEFFEAVGSQMTTICGDATDLLKVSDYPYGDLPLIVLSSSNPEPSRAFDQERLAARSTRGRHIVAPHSGHWIPLDEPELVIQAIRDVIDLARVSRATLPESFRPSLTTSN